MMLTEQEAKTKWCPHARMRGYYGANRDGAHLLGGTQCLASGCMKWRWVPGKSPEEAANWDPCKTGPKGYCGA